MVGTTSVHEQRQRNFINMTLVAAVILLVAIGVGAGFYMGERTVKSQAVDANAGSYIMTDKYGTVEWHWSTTASKTDMASASN